MKFRVPLWGLAAAVVLAVCVQAQDPAVSPIPNRKTLAAAHATSVGCLDCHTGVEAQSMHQSPAVVIGCADCHGGDAGVRATDMVPGSEAYREAVSNAHVAPRYPQWWRGSRNPEHSYTHLLRETYEFVKFINPGDLRVARETCGGCHAEIVHAVERSLMTTSAMLWGGASYNNGILPYKNYILGESYGSDGKPRAIHAPGPVADDARARGALAKLLPIPQWEVMPPADVFRVFERGGFFNRTQFAEVGVPNPFEEPGRPDIRASNRGPGTGARIAVPVLNIHKTRLNDPHLSMLGTNDHPGDYRSSGCTACHSIYANDRDPRHSGPYAKFGHEGRSITRDPTIPKDQSGHPLVHQFTRAIPTSQCMVCHMHQPNMFVNSYLGYTMWDYEVDAPSMWPKQQRYPTDEETYQSLLHNPEEAAVRGKWTDREFLNRVSELNPTLTGTQFADYHGHGWNFRAIFKRDRKGNLLDPKDKKVPDTDPQKFKKAVHMSDIHVDKGMHCVDCHFSQDAHGDGHIYGEVAQAVEIRCQDCHGTVKNYATLRTSGPAAADGGRDLTLLRTQFGEQRFVWREGRLYQRSNVNPGMEWHVRQVRDSVDAQSPLYNPRSARAKTVEKLRAGENEGRYGNLTAIDAAADTSTVLAHDDERIACFTCHSSWMTSCAGCHLPIQANWKKTSNHYDGKETRNWASYNPQVARDEMFQIGIHGPAKKFAIVPVRSSSALVLSSMDANRQIIYAQQPPVSSAGYSSQAFAPHFPHTVRTKETKGCDDCHVSKANDNNAILAQLFLLGTNFVNFMGYHTFVATGKAGLEAIQVTEWSEPQAVIGSYLHRYAYPDFYQKHLNSRRELATAHVHHGAGGETNAVQARGEYLFTTAGSGGFRVYDVANVSNKGFSERIVTGPFSPLGHDTHVASTDATHFALPTTMPISTLKQQLPENLEQPMHPVYSYAFITDRVEGLIAVDVMTLTDGEPRNNVLSRAMTWNEGGVLTGARHIQLAGSTAYVATDTALVALNLDTPLQPRVLWSEAFRDPRGVAVQFRYLFVVDAEGMHVIDITHRDRPRRVRGAQLPLRDARSVHVARTYAYVAGGSEGLLIVDIERPESPRLYQRFTDQGLINDLYDVKIATTNASLFAYLADGQNGLVVVQLTDPERVPTLYGFSPEVKPAVIARRRTEGPALAISKPLDRDRAVDETGHQVSVFGRIGSRPFTKAEMERLYLRRDGSLYSVTR